MKKTYFIILLIFVLFLGGCFFSFIYEESPPLTPVKVQLKWLHQAQFAGNYVAQEKGFYEKRGINVTDLVPFDYIHWPIAQVENKEVDFAITGAEELILDKSKGDADHIKAVAVIFKTNPVCLYSLKKSNIVKPQDLIGKTVGIERGSNNTEINVGILYHAMINKLGLNSSKINEVTIGYDATELLAGETDVSSGYIINEPHQVIELGQEVNVILPAEYGVNTYADVIIVHEDTIKNNPELVRNFVQATLEGWQYAIENEDETIDIVMDYALDSVTHQRYMLEESIPLIYTGDSKLGLMKESDWQSALDILQGNELYLNNLSANELFTNQFIDDK